MEAIERAVIVLACILAFFILSICAYCTQKVVESCNERTVPLLQVRIVSEPEEGKLKRQNSAGPSDLARSDSNVQTFNIGRTSIDLLPTPKNNVL
jgi:hypothetical protein